jgi:hypothetical protein
MPLSEAEKWLDHLTSCSPCYRDFSQLRVAERQRRTRTLLAMAAGILIIAGLASWAWFARQREPFVAQTAVIDLRSRSVARGSESNPIEPPLEVSRKATRWIIYLPLGSSVGPYDLRLLTSSGEPLVTMTSIATISNGIASLQVSMDVSSARPGRYVLEIRKLDLQWKSYALGLH